MPLISTVTPTEATGKVAETYSQIEQTFRTAVRLYLAPKRLCVRLVLDRSLL